MSSNSQDTVKAFAENLPGAAFYYQIDEHGQDSIEFLNEGCEQIWSVSASEIENDPSPLWDMIHSDDLEAMKASVVASAQTLELWEARFRIIDANGRQKNLMSRGKPTALLGGGVRWLTFLFDVTAETRTEELFHRVTRQLDYISKAIPDGFALFDPHERLVVCNDLFRKAYGFQAGFDLRGLSYEALLKQSADLCSGTAGYLRDSAWITTALEQLREGTSKSEQAWHDGRWMRVVDRKTEDGGRVAFRIDITDAVARKTELERAAATDPVTGLLNRRGLSLNLNQMCKDLRPDQRLYVMHLDLDKFKSINDLYGHETGDRVLIEIARRLLAHCGEASSVARVGGDEFVIVHASAAPEAEVLGTADDLRHLITEPILFDGRVCGVGATLGIASWSPGCTETIEQTLSDADTALSFGKLEGRNKKMQFSPEMRAAALTTGVLAAEIKKGLAASAFEPFFQPQVAYPEGTLIGLEALARWHRTDGEYVSAGTFIDVANETGLITQIDYMILQKALDVVAELEQGGLSQPSVSINLSAMQLSTDDIVETLIDEAFTRGVSPSQINVEVLESTLLDDRSDKICQNINTLARAGFLIELDDFGTGHTALASLTTFPVHRIKIDRSLISGIDKDRKKVAVVSGLYLVCSKLNIEAIAEGVETQEELKVLSEIGLTKFQGYYFAKPLPFVELLSWIRRSQRVA